MKRKRGNKDSGKRKRSSGEENIRKLRKVIQADEALQEKLGRLKTGDDIFKALSELGAEKGLNFTKRDFTRLVADPDKKTDELTQDEITSMAGGFHLYPPKTAWIHFGNTLIQTLRWFDIRLQR